ncbi:ubiquitin-like protein ATG12 [Haliotis rubra]|uniref:ubiquitin-like protein ATG12 n=1 Tax=Haliotis rubra TaxID=36100 RepID=UPI001EE51804|nr:ubiquitin-like protein ATG12 [Haliotis rubra]
MSDENTNTEERELKDNDQEGKVTDKADEQVEHAPHDVGLIHQDSQSAGTANAAQQKMKIDVLLKPAGDAPIMKKKKWAVDRTKRVSWVCEFIRKYIKLDISESLFLYVNQSFAPSPDTDVGVLFDCFGSDGKLVLHYCRTQAWG